MADTGKKKRLAKQGSCSMAMVLAILASAAEARPTLELKNLRAEIEITPENRADFAISVDMTGAQDAIDKNGAKGGAPMVDIRGNDASISANWDTGVRAFNVEVNGVRDPNVAYWKAAAHKPQPHPAGLPHIRIRAPMDFVVKSNAQVFGHIGPSHSLKMDEHGRGEWTIDAVAGAVDIWGWGTTNFHIASAASASFDTAVTSNIDCGDVGTLGVYLNGAGDVRVDHVKGRADVTIGGMGDFTAQSVAGPVIIDMLDAGSVQILEGSIPKLTIRSGHGLGLVDVAGTVGDADISIGTKTRVHLHRVTGKLKSKTREDAQLKIDQP